MTVWCGEQPKNIVSLPTTGAKKITLAITCPAIRHPCFYGIDFPSPKELIATETEEEIEMDWGRQGHLSHHR